MYTFTLVGNSIFLSAASRRAAAHYVLGSVCLCAVNLCKQDISKTYLLIFISEAPYILPWKWLTFDAGHIQDGWLSAILVSFKLLAGRTCWEGAHNTRTDFTETRTNTGKSFFPLPALRSPMLSVITASNVPNTITMSFIISYNYSSLQSWKRVAYVTSGWSGIMTTRCLPVTVLYSIVKCGRLISPAGF